EVILLDVGKQEDAPAGRLGLVGDIRRGKSLVGILVIVIGEADLFQVVGALHASGGLADLLDRGQEQADQNGDDCNDHPQLDESECASCPSPVASHDYVSTRIWTNEQ